MGRQASDHASLAAALGVPRTTARWLARWLQLRTLRLMPSPESGLKGERGSELEAAVQ